jgi:hypothetical protein
VWHQINAAFAPNDIRYDPLLHSGDTIFVPEPRAPGFKPISAAAP